MISLLAGLGIDFITSMVKDHGSDLVTEGIKKVTGIDLKKKKELTPAEITAIREAEVALKKLDFEEIRIYLADLNSARDMQKAALSQEDLFSKRFIYYYAMFITFVSFVYIFMITFSPIPEGSVRFADTVLGFLLGVGLSSIINFFFGSSKGSKDKTDSLIKGMK